MMPLPLFVLRTRTILSGLKRRPVRSLLTASGVAVAMAALFYLLAFERGYRVGLRAELDRLGAHILLVPKGCPYDAASIALHGASWPCYLPEKYIETVRHTQHVAVAAPVLMEVFYGGGENARQTVYCGIDAAMSVVKSQAWRSHPLPSKPGDLLVGSEAARVNGWHTDEMVSLPGLPGRRGRVIGILKTAGGAEDGFVYLDLADAQKLFRRPGQLTHVLVRLDDPDALDEVVGSLRGCDAGLEMNVVPLSHLYRTIQSLIQSTRLLLGSVVLVALLAAGCGVTNAVLMTVSERTREIGVLRAIGASPGDVVTLVAGETLCLCLMGGLMGIVGALCAARGVEAWLRARLPYAPEATLVLPDAGVFLLCLTGCAVLGALSALVPAWRASRLSPVEAMRGLAGG